MKQIYFLLLLLGNCFSIHAQLVPCRPRICMLNYGYHNDLIPNGIMDTIKALKPDILIDNTPGGYWGQVNGGTGCNPAEYIPLGIKVYSYIAGGYEGTRYHNHIDSLGLNLLRVDAIAADGANGVFLDEVTAYPTAEDKLYIQAIRNRCNADGLQLILNPGVHDFDDWLTEHCDYLLSDEGYKGNRMPTQSELNFIDHILVVADSVDNADTAARISLGARANGFRYSYACREYIYQPSWILDYATMITQPPATPVISQLGSNKLVSTAPAGNQWYNTQGPLTSQTNDTLSLAQSGSYYTIVTLDGCPSDTSNTIQVTITGIDPVAPAASLKLYPDPAPGYFFAETGQTGGNKATISIYTPQGKLLRNLPATPEVNRIDMSGFSNGIYFVTIRSDRYVITKRLILQQ